MIKDSFAFPLHKWDPEKTHLFVCINDRGENRSSCAGGEGEEVLKRLKEEIKKRGMEDEFKVSASFCMGACGRGPNVMAYPQKVIFSQVAPEEASPIVDQLKKG